MARRRGVLALREDGQLTLCESVPELVGTGRCKHIDHMRPDETEEEFIRRIENKIAIESSEKIEEESYKSISQEEIDSYAKKIDEIAGEKVTPENYQEILKNLPPDKLYEIVKIGFESAPEFSLPITDEEYFEQNLNNKLYFADLPTYGISGKRTAIEQMFVSVGEVPNDKGSVFIEGNYKKGLNPDEYFEKQFSSRAASIAKSVSVSEPGYISRKLFYALSDIQVQEDCKNKKSKGVLDCSIPGGICVKCAKKDGIDLIEGRFIGSSLSTNLAEPLTQLSMREFHPIYSEQIIEIINDK